MVKSGIQVSVLQENQHTHTYYYVYSTLFVLYAAVHTHVRVVSLCALVSVTATSNSINWMLAAVMINDQHSITINLLWHTLSCVCAVQSFHNYCYICVLHIMYTATYKQQGIKGSGASTSSVTLQDSKITLEKPQAPVEKPHAYADYKHTVSTKHMLRQLYTTVTITSMCQQLPHVALTVILCTLTCMRSAVQCVDRKLIVCVVVSAYQRCRNGTAFVLTSMLCSKRKCLLCLINKCAHSHV